MASRGLHTTSVTMLRNTSPNAPGAALEVSTTLAKTILIGNSELANTANTAAINVVNKYSITTVLKRLPNPL